MVCHAMLYLAVSYSVLGTDMVELSGFAVLLDRGTAEQFCLLMTVALLSWASGSQRRTFGRVMSGNVLQLTEGCPPGHPSTLGGCLS
jgi:hypothetical protein